MDDKNKLINLDDNSLASDDDEPLIKKQQESLPILPETHSNEPEASTSQSRPFSERGTFDNVIDVPLLLDINDVAPETIEVSALLIFILLNHG